MTMKKKYYKPTPVPPRLTVELVPSTSWYSNVRSEVTPGEWDKIRKYVYRRANYLCEICSGRGSKWPVECHEIWVYDDDTHIQELAGMQALCPSCHMVKHMGLSIERGKGMEVMAHLCKINHWQERRASTYIQHIFEQWHVRSGHEWSLNLFYLETLTKELS